MRTNYLCKVSLSDLRAHGASNRRRPCSAPVDSKKLSDDTPSKFQGRKQGVVVAATVGEDRLLFDGRPRATGVDSIHPIRIHTMHALAERSLRPGACPGVQIADEHQGVPGLRVLAKDPQQVVRRGIATAHAPRVDRQGAVVVHDENHALGLLVLKPHPLRAALAVPLLGPVLGHLLRAALQPLEATLVEGQPQGDVAVAPLQPRVVVAQPCVPEHEANVLALLETHEVVRLCLAALSNQSACATSVSTSDAEQVPPKQIVREDLQSETARASRIEQVPIGLRDLNLAPSFTHLVVCRRTPSEVVHGLCILLGRGGDKVCGRAVHGGGRRAGGVCRRGAQARARWRRRSRHGVAGRCANGQARADAWLRCRGHFRWEPSCRHTGACHSKAGSAGWDVCGHNARTVVPMSASFTPQAADELIGDPRRRRQALRRAQLPPQVAAARRACGPQHEGSATLVRDASGLASFQAVCTSHRRIQPDRIGAVTRKAVLVGQGGPGGSRRVGRRVHVPHLFIGSGGADGGGGHLVGRLGGRTGSGSADCDCGHLGGCLDGGLGGRLGGRGG
mmetsp:Transcript_109062/g.352025  ORF Transcript_109062/g.352025 Transcript_109062/m.352025 type:complete len:563 (-) Transcript_109062:720-2408(-)